MIQPRELSRADEDLRAEANRLTNRLREELYRWLPHLLALSPSADEPGFWDLVEHLVRSDKVGLRRSQAEALLRRHRIRRLAGDDVLATLAAERLKIAPGAAEAARTTSASSCRVSVWFTNRR